MDLSSPISSVIPSAHGAVLAVLARTDEPLSGRRVAALTNGRFGQWRVNEVLGQLADAGVALRESHPPAKLYRLNRDHVAAAGITALAEQWNTLLSRIRAELDSWQVRPEAAWLFGSAARGEAGSDSDIDILLVRSPTPTLPTGDADQPWQAQVETLTERVSAWSGNPCEVLELTTDELLQAVERDDRLVRDLRDHALPLAGQGVRALLRREVRR